MIKKAVVLLTLAINGIAVGAPAQERPWPADRGNRTMPPREYMALMWSIPAPYTSAYDPLPQTTTTVERGGHVYEAHCVSCHGPTGKGDGEAARGLKPPPGNLARLAQMPFSRWDSFMYWTICEGGVPFGTAMPAFKDVLSKDDIWAVVTYIRARLPIRRTRH